MKKRSKKSNHEKKQVKDYKEKHIDDENAVIIDGSGKKKKAKKKKKHPKLRLFFKIFFIVMLILIIVGIAGVVAIFRTDKWALTEEQLLVDSMGATIYDGKGEVINTLTGDEINKKLTIADMGKLPDAFISIEDERFYEHHGIDVKRTLHAIVNYVGNKVLRRGGGSTFGGSTITQQLIKITMKDDEQNGIEGIIRKIREWSRAVQVEKMLNKDEILERYLNRIYLGSSNGLEVRGVEAAANYYFNKSAKDLSLVQTAFIAGINNSPNSYNPFGEADNTEKIKTRTLNVIAKMKELGKITEEEYNQAVEEAKNRITFEKGSVSNGKGNLSFHTAAAIDQIAKELSNQMDISYNEARELAINSGYSIYTTVDQSIQDKMEAEFVLSKYIMQGTSEKGGKHEPGQSAMVIIEPSTGFVVGEVGALGENQDTLGLNRGLSERQPGSSFKPLATIAPGLENKTINAATLFYDALTNFGTYRPHNDSSSGYGGITSIRNAIMHSYNVTEVKLLSILGLSKSEEFLSKIGMQVDSNEFGLSMALGAPSVTPVQMAAGFAMIANKGVYITPTFYTKVVDKDGNTVIEAKQEKTRVMSEQNAYIESTILQGPISGGTASSFRGVLGAMDVAGKTGTSDAAADRWFCGFTPYYAAACWYGADDGYNIDGKRTRMSFWGGSNPAAKIWFPVMKKVHEGLEVKKFEKPADIVTLTICKATGKKATDSCTDTYSEIFAKDNVPADCQGHQSVKICKETGKIATEFCPDTEDKVFGIVIDTEKNGNWSPKQQAEEAPTETCNVHKEAERVPVPSVVGKTEAEATKALKDAGFTVKVSKDNDRNKAKGVVLKQSATGTAPKGSQITITVNQFDGGTQTGGNTTTEKPTTGGNTTTGGNSTTGGSTKPPENTTNENTTTGGNTTN